ncbi:MAG: gliding motility-associated C-terminal domain-containing protein [Raineya sp.]|jgi:gliding motility-associated-like protein|nr:gliding motility-associated C-terminal domain-containing protein [Raineya sp.]
MKYFYSFFLSLLSYTLFGQTGPFRNPSFEVDISNLVFYDWIPCAFSSTTPDIQPKWDTSILPYQGNHYMGMVTRGGLCNTCNESVSQKLLYPLSQDTCYSFDIMLSHDFRSYTGYSSNAILKIWAGNNPLTNCGREELLWTSPPPPTGFWSKYSVRFSPKKNYTHIILEVYYPNLIANNAGNIEIDYIHNYKATPKNINFNLGNNTTICQGDSLTLEVNLPTSQTSYPIKWSTGATTSKIIVSEPGIYWAEVQAPCAKFRDSVEIKQEICFFIPNAFTPNNDGVNETFYIKGIKKGNWQLQIYDRRGLLIYENNAYKNDWKGDNLPATLYYYRLFNEETKEDYKGWVQIIK